MGTPDSTSSVLQVNHYVCREKFLFCKGAGVAGLSGVEVASIWSLLPTLNHFSLVNHQTVYLHLSHVMLPPRLT